MITLIDKYGFIKQLQVALPPGTHQYRMACVPPGSQWERLWESERNALYAPSFETRTFYRQGATNVFEER